MSDKQEIEVLYKQREDGDYDILLNEVPVAVSSLLDDETDVLVFDLTNFIDGVKVDSEQEVVVEIKNDDDLLGVIVDVWDEKQEEIIETACFWFDDYVFSDEYEEEDEEWDD